MNEIHTLICRTCEYYLRWPKELAYAIHSFKDFDMEDYPGLSKRPNMISGRQLERREVPCYWLRDGGGHMTGIEEPLQAGKDKETDPPKLPDVTQPC